MKSLMTATVLCSQFDPDFHVGHGAFRKFAEPDKVNKPFVETRGFLGERKLFGARSKSLTMSTVSRLFGVDVGVPAAKKRKISPRSTGEIRTREDFALAFG